MFTETLGPVAHRFTRPYRPQTNGKVERFNRTLLEEWAYVPPMPQRRTERPRLQCGFTSTTITATTLPSGASHP